MGGMSGQQLGQLLGSIGGLAIGGPPGMAIGGQATGAIGGAIDPATGLPQAQGNQTNPAAAQDQSSAQLQANAAQAVPQVDPNQQLLQMLMMLINQGPQQ